MRITAEIGANRSRSNRPRGREIPNHDLFRAALARLAIDSARGRFYIAAMTAKDNAQFDQELKRLEKRVDALVEVCDQLQNENHSLRQRQDTLTSERANLLQKNEQVRARVEAMIGRLKAMEQGG